MKRGYDKQSNSQVLYLYITMQRVFVVILTQSTLWPYLWNFADMEQDLSSRPDFPAEITTAPVIERSVHSWGLDLTGQQSANNPKPSTGSWLKSITFALFCTNQWMLYLICYLWQDSCGRPQVMALAVHMLGRYMGSHTHNIYIYMYYIYIQCIYIYLYSIILYIHICLSVCLSVCLSIYLAI